MLSFNKILRSTLAIATIAIASVSAYGQDANFYRFKHKKPFTIGFQTGRDFMFHSSPLLHNRQGKVHPYISNTLVLRKPLSEHFKMETGIRYTAIPNNTAHIKGLDKKALLIAKSNVAIPMTLQYHFIPEHFRLHAYCGAGLQYNICSGANNSNATYPPFNSDINLEHRTSVAGTKYISVLITQGITFQINTKIQLSESIHFIPAGPEKSIGFDIGVGYNVW